jgi:chemotaxis protein MotB
VPIHTPRYDSNWELSTARATNVVALLTQAYLIDATRLSAAGYSEFHPQVPNDSEANRGRNRRVDIVILNPGISRREEPAPVESRQPGRLR